MSLRAIASSFQSVNYQGTWDASTNNPALTSSVGTKGYYYVVSVAGSTNLNGITNWGVGDWAVFNGSVWQRVEGGADGNFVNVTLTSTDAGAAAAPLLDLYRDSASPAASDTLGEIEFNGEDSAGNKQAYGLIHASILSPTSTAEQGQLHFETATAGALTEKMIIGTTNLVINEIGAVFNVRIEGDGEANLFYTDATNDRIGVGTASPDAQLTVNTIASFGAGAVATPSIAAKGDLNTGVWFPAADTFAISTAGAERMRIDSAGNVGIGTTTTSGKLNVTGGTIEFDPGNGADSTRAFNFNITGTNFGKILIPLGSGGAMAFWTGSPAAERMRIGSTGIISLGAAPGSESLRVTPVASAVNYVLALGATTGNSPNLSAEGSDTNINFIIKSKGTAVTGIYGNQVWLANLAGERQFVVTNTASAVNYLQVTGGATGSAPSMSAVGSDTNIDLTLTPKGTGVVQYGTYTAGVVAQTGYITIKDAGGTTRRLLVG